MKLAEKYCEILKDLHPNPGCDPILELVRLAEAPGPSAACCSLHGKSARHTGLEHTAKYMTCITCIRVILTHTHTCVSIYHGSWDDYHWYTLTISYSYLAAPRESLIYRMPVICQQTIGFVTAETQRDVRCEDFESLLLALSWFQQSYFGGILLLPTNPEFHRFF